MKRTNLVLDGDLLDEAMRACGERTYSATVNKALAEMVRLHKARGILIFQGSGAWQGDLTTMREDRPPYGKTTRAKK